MLDREYRYVVQDPYGARTLIVPQNEFTYAGDPSGIVLDIEARTRTRLRDGGNPCWFIRLWHQFQEKQDPAANISFAEYCARRFPDAIETETAPSDDAALPDDAIQALEALAGKSRRLTKSEWAGQACMGTRTLDQHIPELRRRGLIDFPKRSKRGAAITEAGREYIAAAR
jgi:hypothetical protein